MLINDVSINVHAIKSGMAYWGVCKDHKTAKYTRRYAHKIKETATQKNIRQEV